MSFVVFGAYVQLLSVSDILGATAAPGCVAGVVKNEAGQPIPGAKVSIRGDRKGPTATTEKNGVFNLEIPQKHAEFVLVVCAAEYDQGHFPAEGKYLENKPECWTLEHAIVLTEADLEDDEIRLRAESTFYEVPSPAGRIILNDAKTGLKRLTQRKSSCSTSFVRRIPATASQACTPPTTTIVERCYYEPLTACRPRTALQNQVFCAPNPCNLPVLDECGRPVLLRSSYYVPRAYLNPCQPIVCSYDAAVFPQGQPPTTTRCGPRLDKDIRELEQMIERMEKFLEDEEATSQSNSREGTIGSTGIQESRREKQRPPSSESAKSKPVGHEWSPLFRRDDTLLLRR